MVGGHARGVKDNPGDRVSIGRMRGTHTSFRAHC